MRRTRVSKSVAELNRDWEEDKRAPIDVMYDFIDSVDASCVQERLDALSPELRQAIEGLSWRNIIAFDDVIAETLAAGDYADGWIAMRDWARSQPWAARAHLEMAPITARARAAARQDVGEDGGRISEQGRMLGILRVHLMRAQTDEERAEISKQIDELTAEFETINRS